MFLAGLALLLLPGWLRAQAVTAPVSRDVLKLDTMKVSGANVGAGDTSGTELTEVYGEQDILDSGAFDLDEFFAQLPPSTAGEEVLVFVDGRPTSMNISDISPEMVASIEVSNEGALPLYGAFANGRVVNIRLKTNYRGEFLSLMTRGSFAGDGFGRTVTLSGMMNRGKLRAFYSLSYREQDALMASERSFSRNQDHTALGGRDLRLLWGEDAVVQAVTGNLAGVLDANGQPTSVALAPLEGNGRGLTPGDFLPAQVLPPASVATAAGQRRFNTSDYVMLATPSKNLSASFGFNRRFGEKGEVSFNGGISRREGHRTSAPPVTSASRDTLVPAADNPFGQDVQVGMVHTGFGPVRQDDRSTSGQLGLTVMNQFSDAWRWRASMSGRWSHSRQEVNDLDRAAFAAALTSLDPARRFNPFGDDPINALLYPDLTVVRRSTTDTARLEAEAFLLGELGRMDGGPARLMLRGSFSEDVRDRSYENPANPVTGELSRRDTSQNVQSRVDLPWLGSRGGAGQRGAGMDGVRRPSGGPGRNAGPAAPPGPWAQRLETSLDVRYSTRSNIDGGTLNSGLGVNWAPFRALRLRANFDATQHAPSRFIADPPSLTGETLIDPLRSPATTADVFVSERDFDGAVRARSERLRFGATFEAPSIPGLELNVRYDRNQRRDLTGSAFRAQDLVYNELTFPGRVVRAAQTADDLRLGQPGRIISVDTTPSDRAAQESSGLTWQIEYRRRSEQLGMFTFSTSARQSLSSRYELVPGVPFVVENNNELNPPDWTVNSRLSWSRRGMGISANHRYVEAVTGGGILRPAISQLQLSANYRIEKPVIGKWGRGVTLQLSLSDLLQGAPPFADTINGYRTGSPMGRTWMLSMRVPLRPPATGSGQGQGGRPGGERVIFDGGPGGSGDDD